MNKKLVSLILAASMIGTLLTGCGSDPAGTGAADAPGSTGSVSAEGEDSSGALEVSENPDD